jgi:CRP/FNR family cyclic AMP-dependent transcriptional regulator
MQNMRETVSGNMGQTHRSGEFFSKLSAAALRDLESLERPSAYPPGVVLFSERETPSSIFIVLSGEVKLSMNSSDGKRLILRIAKAGEIIGLVPVVSGGPAEMTAETVHPARIATVGRREFLDFLSRHPEVYQILTVELSRHLNRVCEQLRTVGLSASAPEKLARLLLDWSENGLKTDAGTRFHFPLTHEEIGEFIGTSRETVTRTMTTFKLRRLVVCHGTSFTIADRMALESFARC